MPEEEQTVRQAYPASITGDGFAAGGSVLDHRFGQSDPFTLGVEEEYMLLDCETFDLVQHIDTVLAATAGHELETRINAELMQSVLEIATPVCRTAADVMAELRTLRAYVGGIAREKGARVGSAGTHPFSLFERQRITARDRYRNLVDPERERLTLPELVIEDAAPRGEAVARDGGGIRLPRCLLFLGHG